MIKKQFTVSGMTCSACSSRVERAVSKTEGVTACSVNLISGVLKVDMERDQTKDILIAVQKEGYGIKEGVERSKGSEREEKLKKRLIISLPLVLLLMYIAMGGMVGLPQPAFLEKPFAFALSQAIIALVVVVVNYSYFTVGFKNLIKLKPNMDSLVALGSTVSFLYGVFAIIMIGLGKNVHTYAHNLYFEGSAMIVAFITFGKFLEEKSKNKTRGAVEKLIGLAPNTAVVLRDGQEVEIKSAKLCVGDVFILKDGFSIPADGEIVEGDGYADESMITGESLPVYKSIGDKAVCGTKFSGGYAKVRAVSVGEDTTVYKIVRLVEEANSTKVPIAGLADKISGVFVPFVIAVSLSAFAIWMITTKDFAFAFNIAVSVLVVSCPCALGLATPASLMAGTGKSAESGILIKSGEVLQSSAKIDTVVFDKTGTITNGEPVVSKIVAISLSEEELIKICYSLEEKSSHVLSLPIINLAREKGLDGYDVQDYTSVRGKGVYGRIAGEEYCFGNLALIEQIFGEDLKIEGEKLLASEVGATVLILTKKDEILGYMLINDQIKQSSRDAVSQLKTKGINVLMLTGDNKKSAEKVARELDIDYVAEVLPEDKHKKILELEQLGKRVMMVGDGVNDAPALESATVGVAIGAGTDIAIESAGVVLIKNDLTDCVKMLQIGKSVMTNIKQNLFWAFIYNLLLIPVACGALYGVGILLNPMIASLAMSLSSVCVVGNALRLRYIKMDKRGEDMLFKKKSGRVAVIDGMMCMHCQKRVEGVFAKLGIEVEINLKKKTATFAETDVSNEEIKSAIEAEGYTVVSIE